VTHEDILMTKMGTTDETGERRTRRGQATRDRIVAIAAELMLQRGVAAVSMRDVRATARVSGSQLSHYFGDKQSLIRAVIAHQADDVVRKHQMPELEELDSFAALDLWARLNIESLEAHDCQGGCSYGSLAAELVECDPSMRSDLAVGFERWEALFRHGLTLMRDRGDLRPDADPDQLTYAIMAALQGGMLLAQTARDATPLRAALTSVLQYIRSYAASPRA
jgi:TetR/AcrR family transcriptional regulator, transcriptional repressor for nem operon